MNQFLLLFTFTLFGGALLAISKRLFATYYAPLGIYSLVWGTMGAVYHLKLIPYPDLQPITLVVIVFSWGSFSLGCLIVGVLAHKHNVFTSSHASAQIDERLFRRVILTTAVLGLIGATIFAYRVIHYFGISQILAVPWWVRWKLTFQAQDVGVGLLAGVYLLGVNHAAIALSGVYLGSVSPRFPLAYLPLINTLVYDAAFLGRAHTVTSGMLYVSSYLLTKWAMHRGKSLRCSTLYIILFTVLVFVWLMGNFLGKTEAVLQFATLPLPGFVLHIANRVAGPLASLDFVLRHHSGNFLLGYATFHAPAEFLHRVGLLGEYVDVSYVSINPVTNWPTSFVTYTYLRFLYDDFGLFGVIIIPFLLGFLSTHLYVTVYVRPSLFSLVVLSFLYVSILYSFGTWKFWNPYFLIAMITAIAASLASDMKVRFQAIDNTVDQSLATR
jgi:oligosaccharide repeat unit polymerase